MYTEPTVSNTSTQQQIALPFRQQIPSKIPSPATKLAACEAGANLYRSQLVRSVAEEAGLGRFVYLKGHSGQRYIFSAIEPRRVGLYNQALFALADQKKESVVIVDRDDVTSKDDQTLYVHLLAEDGPTSDNIVADLQEARLRMY